MRFLASFFCFFSIFFMALRITGSENLSFYDLKSMGTVKTIQGESLNLEKLKNKVVIVDFWATWCPPCVKEIPHFIELQEKYKAQGVLFVEVSLDKQPSTVETFIKENKINYPIVMMSEKWQKYFGEIPSIPTTFVLRGNQLTHKTVGFHSKDYFENEIKVALKPLLK